MYGTWYRRYRRYRRGLETVIGEGGLHLVPRWVDPLAVARDPKPCAGKLTPELVEAICESHSGGVFVEHACQRAGVSDQTLRNWRAAHPWVEEAFGRAHAHAVEVMRAMVLAEPGGARWALERFDRAAFAPPPREAQEAPPAPAGLTLTLPLSDLRELARLGSPATRAAIEATVARDDDDEPR